MSKQVPEFKGNLRSFMLTVPKSIYGCSGILIFGKRIKSIVFTTDVSIIRNTNADAIIAVYPFTPQPIITRAIMMAADTPVFCGVGGGRTKGERAVVLAVEAEQQGAIGVVFNAPTPNETIKMVAPKVDIPIVITIVSEHDDIQGRIDSGAQILNVSAAAKTPELVRSIRKKHPNIPIMATGGPNDETIERTIAAGANAITWTPPSTGEIFSDIMNRYRDGKTSPED